MYKKITAHKKLMALLLGAVFSFSALADPVIVGNPALPDGLTKKDAKKIFLGKKNNYTSEKLFLIELPGDNPMKATFHKKVTKKSLAQLEAYWSKQLFTGKLTPPVEVIDVTNVKLAITQNPTGIGYIDEADVDATVKVLFKP